ncbi:MAG: amidase [Alphaproteobacteria bacterium]|nr:MAG: amidase [Alphaproteobacteria bacterium]
MTIKTPTPSQIIDAGLQLGLDLTEVDAEEYIAAMAPLIGGYNAVDSMPDNVPEVKYPRTPGYQPEGEENKYNAWYRKTSIKGAPEGKLAGQRVAIKDNICVSGVPMMAGASVLEGYVPDIDATVVTRVLDAGGEIAGKAQCEYLCFSGASHTGAAGAAVTNPWNEKRTTGGSSSGCAALIAAGELFMAIGCDQAGSIRVPASFSGIVGMKPTHGLVPYSGIMPIELTLDHCGPMSDTVKNNALLLEVIAGEDGLDPRQYGAHADDYTSALNGDIAGLKIGVLEEGFGHENSDPNVEVKVRAAADHLTKLGAEISTISIPLHLLNMAIWTPIGVEGTLDFMMHGNGFGTNWRGLYVTSLLKAFSSWPHRANELSESLKYVILLGQYMLNQYGGYYYAKAQNQARRLRAAYDQELAKVDLIMMPTLPMTATEIPPQDADRTLIIQRAHEMFGNTAAFDVTGHPALSIPCGLSDGLPVGLMLVGRHYDEATIYRAAYAFEQAADWKQL